MKKLFSSPIRRAAVAAALVLAACMLTGCGASLTVYDYTENGERYQMYELELPRAAVDAMEATAADIGGRVYTVPQYFYELFGFYGYDLESAALTASSFRARYRKKFVSSTPELYQAGAVPEFEYTVTDGFFVRDITARADNPFNGVRAAYDAVEPGKSGTLIQQLKNGVVSKEYGETVVLFPAVQDAFPALVGADLDGLLLNYVMFGSARMDASGTTDGEGTYMFSRYFDTTETQLSLRYSRPMPVGWYVTALLAGAAVVGAVWFVTKPKKPKPTLLERFPYNPEEFRDYDSHLPWAG